ncbi:hypothetical protein ACQKMD_20225 [Viridibacillus sp. NPDC096237]|uniref:hypothetical protein n=1 Tax=Viridibacillus sp. NPDC096237 TaxID=3390721 RepID=UPI003D017B1A
MKKTLLKSIIVFSYIYCIGYFLFDFPNDTFVMRIITGVMSFIFSCSLLLKILDNKKEKELGSGEK